MSRLLFCLFGALCCLAAPVRAQMPGAVPEHVRASLISDGTFMPGEPFYLALKLELEPGWHVYWRNPGDSGLAPTLAWTLPDGFKAGDIQWPVPKQVPIAPLMDYGYEDAVVLPVPVTPQVGLAAGSTHTFNVRADWLVCKDICVPEGADLTATAQALDPTVVYDVVMTAEAKEIRAALARVPKSAPQSGTVRLDDNQVMLEVPLPNVATVEGAQFFPVTLNLMAYSQPVAVTLESGTVRISATAASATLPKPPIEGVVALADGTAWQVSFASDRLSSPESQSDSRATSSRFPYSSATQNSGNDETGSLPRILLFALLGGIILNAMPCVFPILSLKALAIVGKAGHERRKVRLGGIAYTLGVLLSFLAIAGLLLALKSGGSLIGWGFQMQSPVFVTAMALLMFAIGLNLAGFFSVPVLFGGFGNQIAQKDNVLGAFATGALAALVATPCTVPFMAGAVGFALTQPAPLALAVFLTLGFGMALPYLLLCWVPALQHRLPRPGLWMETFKQFLSFPMFATAVWLVWVLTMQAGADGMLAALAGMVALAFGLWLWRVGDAVHPLRRVAGVVVIAGSVAFSLLVARDAMGPGLMEKTMERGVPYSEAKLAELRAAGTPVFVDVTAAWCLTCKVNERVALSTVAVHEAFEKREVVLMIADWTSRDDAITRYLAGFGRSGVPLYVWYPPRGEPKVLPQLLSESLILETIAR